MKYIISILFFCLASNLCNSQNIVNIKGKVSSSNGKPLSGVIVSLYKDSASKIYKYAISDNLGEFSVNQIDTYYNYSIKFSLLGFDDTVIHLKADGILKIMIPFSIQMKASIHKLKDVLVQAKRKITENGDTTIFNAIDFGSEKESKLEDVLKNLPGIQVDDDGNIKFKGKPVNKVLIEGDDLFGRNYKLMTQSLGAYTLSKVEAIENDAENPLLKDFFGTKQTNLNIKLKKEFFFKIFGDVTAKLGIDQRYVLDANTYSIAGKNKFSIVATSNNSGIDNRSKANVNIINPILNLDNVEDVISLVNPLNIDFVRTTRPPLLSKELNLLNNDYLVNGNYLRKLSPSLDLRTNIVYLKSDNYFDQYRQTTFINTLNPTVIKESLLGSKSINSVALDNRLSYFNNKKLRLIYSSQISFKSDNSQFSLLLPLDTILPTSVSQKNGINNSFNFTYKASKNTTVDFNIDQIYLATVSDNRNSTNDSNFKKIIGIDQTENFYYNLRDYFNSISFRSNIYFKEMRLRKTKLNLSVKVKIKNSYESFKNELSYLDGMLDFKIGSDAFNQKNEFKFFQKVLGPKLVFENVKWVIRLEPQLINETIFQETKSINRVNRINYFYLNPNVYIKYKLTGYSSIELSYVDGSRVINYQDIFGGSRFTDYRSTLSSSIAGQNIPLIKERKFGIVYSNIRISKGSIFQSNIFFSRANNPIIGDYIYTPLYNAENKIIGLNPYNNNSLLFLYEKAIPKIKSYVSITNFSSQNLSQSRNLFTNIQQISYTLQNDLSVRSVWSDKITTKFTYALLTNIQKIESNRQDFISNLSKLRSEFSFSNKSKEILFKTATEHYWFNGILNGMPFLSANLSYQLSRNKILISISGNNLLNNTKFNFFNTAATNSNQQNTILQQRLIQFGINIKF